MSRAAARARIFACNRWDCVLELAHELVKVAVGLGLPNEVGHGRDEIVACRHRQRH